MGSSTADWVAAGWGHRIESIDGLMRSISRIGTLQAGRRYVWRGVRDWRWRISTSLQRFGVDRVNDFDHRAEDHLRALEREIIALARYWRLDRAGTASDPALLALLQHHGSPTRLLDVTTDPMTALWFACERNPRPEPDASGVLFAFDITEFTRVETSVSNMPPTLGSMGEPKSWHYGHHLVQSSVENQPFVVEPSERDARMLAQQGLFLAGAVAPTDTIPGLDAFALEAVPPGPDKLEALFRKQERSRGRPTRLPFVALVIPTSIKARMKQHLETTYARERRFMFPDLAGLAEALNQGALPVKLRHQDRNSEVSA